MAIEFMVRPITRYLVTKFEDGRSEGAAWNTGSSYLGTFDNPQQANRVAVAMAASEGGVAVTLDPGDVRGLEAKADAACEDQIRPF